MRFDLTEGDEALEKLLSEGLGSFNSQTTGITDGRALQVKVTDGSGDVVGGLSAWTWGGSAFVDRVWLHERVRGQGLGAELMRRAEAEMRERGCTQIVLQTFSFQAPGFYEKLGFERLFAVDDHPKGHQDILLRKRLA